MHGHRQMITVVSVALLGGVVESGLAEDGTYTKPRKIGCVDPDPLDTRARHAFRFSALMQTRAEDDPFYPRFGYTTLFRKKSPSGGIGRAIKIARRGGQLVEWNLRAENRRYWVKSGDVVTWFDDLFTMVNMPSGAIFYRVTDLLPEDQRPTRGVACFSVEASESAETFAIDVRRVSRNSTSNEAVATARFTAWTTNGRMLKDSGVLRVGERICHTSKDQIRVYQVTRIVPGFFVSLPAKVLKNADIPEDRGPKYVRGWVELDPLPVEIHPRPTQQAGTGNR